MFGVWDGAVMTAECVWSGSYSVNLPVGCFSCDRKGETAEKTRSGDTVWHRWAWALHTGVWGTVFRRQCQLAPFCTFNVFSRAARNQEAFLRHQDADCQHGVSCNMHIKSYKLNFQHIVALIYCHTQRRAWPKDCLPQLPDKCEMYLCKNKFVFANSEIFHTSKMIVK